MSDTLYQINRLITQQMDLLCSCDYRVLYDDKGLRDETLKALNEARGCLIRFLKQIGIVPEHIHIYTGMERAAMLMMKYDEVLAVLNTMETYTDDMGDAYVYGRCSKFHKLIDIDYD